MINRAGNKEKAKRVLNENGNLSGMVGMEILYRVIAAITSVLLGAMIAGGIGVVSAVVSAPFKLFGLAGIIIAYVLITPIATLVGAIAGGAVAGPFEVARYRYYLSLRKNGIRPKVTCIFDAFDFFMQFALVTGVRMLTIMWIPVLIQFATLLLAAVVAAASRSYLAAMLLVMIGMIAALVVAAYRSYQFWPMALVQADHPQLNAEQVMERCKAMTEGRKFDLFVFDLKAYEAYQRSITVTPEGKEKRTTSRKPLYPEEWKNQFGLPVDEHRKRLHLNIYDGYAVFGLKEAAQQPIPTPLSRNATTTPTIPGGVIDAASDNSVSNPRLP